MAIVAFIMGPPGAGKDTQARRLQSAGFSAERMSDLLRQKGLIARSAGGDGSKLVPDEQVNEVAEEFFATVPLQYQGILNGFPRTKAQAKCAVEYFRGKNGYTLVFIIIDLSDEDCWHRIDGRMLEGEKREDDHPEHRADRLRIYRQEHAEIDPYLAEEVPHSVYVVNGNQSEEAVAADILQRVLAPICV